MKVTYKGIKQELSPKIRAKLDAKFAKLSKLLEKRGEQEAHVVVTSERHLHKAEITIQFYDHQLLGVASDADLFKALWAALDKIEIQAVKNRGKWREKRKEPASEPRRAVVAAKTKRSSKPVAVVASSRDEEPAQRVFRVNHQENRKPMTLDEAILEMEKNHDYLVYRDADKDRMSVLVRRPDGHFDLIES